jgi:hypothetical protein
MNHPVIIGAFANQENQANNNDNETKIYLLFKRANIFYRDLYYILTGTKEEVKIKIKKAYQDVEDDKNEYSRSDDIDLLDTPFDTWCSGACLCDNVRSERIGSERIGSERIGSERIGSDWMRMNMQSEHIHMQSEHIHMQSEHIKCDNNTAIKCASNWTYAEYTSEEALNAYIKDIKPGYYANYSIYHM